MTRSAGMDNALAWRAQWEFALATPRAGFTLHLCISYVYVFRSIHRIG